MLLKMSSTRLLPVLQVLLCYIPSILEYYAHVTGYFLRLGV